jgi:hypothetical protein
MQAGRLRATHLSFGVLAAIGESGASTTELVEMLSRGRMYHPWPASRSTPNRNASSPSLGHG